MGCELAHNVDGSIIMSQCELLRNIKSTILNTDTHNSPRLPDRSSNEKELHVYRSTIGKLLDVSRMAQPIVLFHASSMADNVSA